MKSFVLSVIYVSAVIGLCSALCPDGEGKNIKKIFTFLMSLILISALAEPISSAIDFMKSGNIDIAFSAKNDGESFGKIWHKRLEEIGEESVEAYISERLTKEFGLKEDEAEVDCEMIIYESEAIIEKIEIKLQGAGLLTNPRKIENVFKDEFKCHCVVN
ncbi:MAG: hypothetical protein IJ303_04080 [Clostridia bacterium]|nr:hypothetical protein [Clostridia bacterium]